jgi:hypothetical protein
MTSPGAAPERPHASRVMGRSARWHDPALLARLSTPAAAVVPSRGGTAGHGDVLAARLLLAEVSALGTAAAQPDLVTAVRLLRLSWRVVQLARRWWRSCR